MLYNTTLSKMLDEVFSFPYLNLDASYGYDNVTSDKNGIKINVVVPGFAKEDLELKIVDNYLNLLSNNEKKSLTRTWKLSDSSDTTMISAECKNGILNINVPFKTKSDKSRSIQIS